MIVLPMAGLSRRFFDEGFELPKYMLDLHGYSVFAHVLGSFADLFNNERFLVVCRDVYNTPSFIKSQCKQIGLADEQVEIIVLSTATNGQAETVAMGVENSSYSLSEPLTIFNIDTFRPSFCYPDEFDTSAIDGYLEVFYGQGEHWSFAKPEPGTNRVIEVTEKIRISDLCSTGLYFFRTAELFLSLYREIEGIDPAKLQGGEYYIAPLYNFAIDRGLDIRYSLVTNEEVRFCGTPQEYSELLNNTPFKPFKTED